MLPFVSLQTQLSLYDMHISTCDGNGNGNAYWTNSAWKPHARIALIVIIITTTHLHKKFCFYDFVWIINMVSVQINRNI